MLFLRVEMESVKLLAAVLALLLKTSLQLTNHSQPNPGNPDLLESAAI